MFESEENINVRLPFGLRDIFPYESSERNAIKRIIRDQFQQWGYGEVKTPVMEYTENISIGVGKDWKNKLINFIDTDGSLISLRADMTIPIARLAGMRIKKDQIPARFCYFSDVFRQSMTQVGNKRVCSQAGLEFIGSKNQKKADAEVLIVLIRIMNALGLYEFKIGLGHIGFINGLSDWFGLGQVQKERLKKNIVLKDFVKIENDLNAIDRKKTSLFMELIKPENNIAKISEAAKKINTESVSGVFKYLEELTAILGDQDYDKYLIFDFSIIRDFDYYTGLLFEVYSPETTEIIGSGGRYDGLIRKFGLDVPATGFAIDIDLLHSALGDSDLVSGFKILLSVSECGCSFKEAIEFADNVRGKGVSVELLFESIDDEERFAIEKNCKILVRPVKGFSKVDFLELESGRSGQYELKIFLEELEKWKKN
ncbi:MAG: ATP phosphoribosyltransferase regulatory subunit [Actinobacteria bacterium]|nr:ATP phosphoribosyltransferase regulatory subunit [Actinomycetota bacterium]